MAKWRTADEQEFRKPYPTYDVLDKWDSPSWNEQTRAVVAKRLNEVPPRRFFSEDRVGAGAGDLRPADPAAGPARRSRADRAVYRRKAAQNRGDGYRYEEMPPMREAWRHRSRGDRRRKRAHAGGGGFGELPANQQDAVLRAVQHGDTLTDAWEGCRRSGFSRAAAARGGRRLLRAPGGLERDRLRRAGLAARLCPARLRTARDPWEARNESEVSDSLQVDSPRARDGRAPDVFRGGWVPMRS